MAGVKQQAPSTHSRTSRQAATHILRVTTLLPEKPNARPSTQPPGARCWAGAVPSHVGICNGRVTRPGHRAVRKGVLFPDSDSRCARSQGGLGLGQRRHHDQQPHWVWSTQSPCAPGPPPPRASAPSQPPRQAPMGGPGHSGSRFGVWGRTDGVTRAGQFPRARWILFSDFHSIARFWEMEKKENQ